MILKVLSRHSLNFKSLLRYIFNEAKADISNAITHNLKTDGIDEMAKEYMENESFRIQERKDSVRMYHEILSFSNKDRGEITEEITVDIARKYIELRGKDGIYGGAIHKDKEHIHIHFCVSGLKYRTGWAFRKSKAELQSIKVELQGYHKDRYPHLSESFCEHGKGGKYVKDRDWHKQKRERVKAGIEQVVLTCFKKSKTLNGFLEQLQSHNLHYYERKGNIEGIISPEGIKFRFKRLGIDIATLKSGLTKERQLLKEIAELRKSRVNKKEITHELN